MLNKAQRHKLEETNTRQASKKKGHQAAIFKQESAARHESTWHLQEEKQDVRHEGTRKCSPSTSLAHNYAKV